jgi:Protein kinase domain
VGVQRDRWPQVTTLFEQTVDLPAEERARVLNERCAADDPVRTEVESLLEAHDAATEFLETPAAAVAGALLEDDADAPSLAGARIGSYLVEEEIARGGMGIVYRARDMALNRLVALKAVSPLQPRDPRILERLRREAQTLAALTDPHIATVYALEQHEDELYIAYELIPGRTLRARLAEGPLPVAAAVGVAIEIAGALVAAHARGIVHRDLKPENVMLTTTGTTKVLDFGIAQIDAGLHGIGSSLTATGGVLGTPGYMSPEQLRDETIDGRSDLFSLGVVLYEMVTGQHPFGRASAASTITAILDREPTPASVLASDVPAALSDLIARSLAKTPDSRYASAAHLLVELERLQLALREGTDPAFPSRVMPAAQPVGTQLWWWRFHLAAATIVHSLMMVPAWRLMEWLPGRAGRLAVYGLLVSVCVAGGLRLHLLFASTMDVWQLAAQYRKSHTWMAWADRAFATILIGGGLAVSEEHPVAAACFIAFAAGSLIASAFVEPATARAALDARNDADGTRDG